MMRKMLNNLKKILWRLCFTRECQLIVLEEMSLDCNYGNIFFALLERGFIVEFIYFIVINSPIAALSSVPAETEFLKVDFLAMMNEIAERSTLVWEIGETGYIFGKLIKSRGQTNKFSVSIFAQRWKILIKIWQKKLISSEKLNEPTQWMWKHPKDANLQF